MKRNHPTLLKTTLLCGLLALATVPVGVQAQSGSAGGSIGNDDKQISGSRSAAPERPSRHPRSEDEPRRSAPRRGAGGGGGGGGGGGNFDGAWVIVGVGTNCQGSATGPMVISGGKLIGEGLVSGSLSPNGAISSVSVANGLTTTGTGRLSGNSGSGSWHRSDGCAGRWSATKS